MNSPIISVITPIYNSDRYIDRFINNYLRASQKIKSELIIIDDGSTDKSIERVIKYQQSNSNIYLYKQSHQYQSAARNLGMKHASGKYLMFLDIDDIFDDNLFSIMINGTRDKKLAICGINRVLSNNTLKLRNSVLEGAINKDELAERFLLDRDQMDSGLWNKIFLKKVIIDNHLLFSNKNFVEDILFVFNYLMCINPQEIRYIHKCLYTYFQNTGTSTTTYQAELDKLALSYVDQVKSILAQHNIKNANVLVANTFVRTEIYIIHRHILGDKEWNQQKQKEFLNQMHKRSKNSLSLLPYKYRVGLVLMNIVPVLYIDLYKLYKRIH